MCAQALQRARPELAGPPERAFGKEIEDRFEIGRVDLTAADAGRTECGLSGHRSSRARKQTLRFLRGIFVSGIVITRGFALTIVPVGDGVDRFVLLRPRFEFASKFGRNFIEGHERFAAMLADQTRFAHVARE